MAHESLSTDFVRNYDMNSPELAHRWDEVVEQLHGVCPAGGDVAPARREGRCPVARSEVGEGYWVLNTYDNVGRAAGDWQTFSSATGFMPNRPEGMPWFYPVESDPPLHESLRDSLNPFFRPKVIAAHEQAIRETALQLVADIRASGDAEVDVVARYCNALPGRVFCGTVAGMPTDGVAELQAALDAAILGPIDGRAAASARAHDQIEAYMRQRQEAPRNDDVVQAVLDFAFEGIGWEERISILTTLTLGGIGTTGFVFASAILYLARHPEERAALLADPARMPAAIEEFIRFYAPSPHDGRRATTDVDVDGVQIKAGQYVVLSYGAASRDPEIFDRPHEVDLERPLPNRHMAFGGGIHRCIGSHLARLELRVGIEIFLQSFPDYTIDEDFEPALQISNTRVMERLPVRVIA